MLYNPTCIEDLKELPDKFRKTQVGDNFLLYDSYEDKGYDLYDRIIVFATRENLKTLFKSDTWYIDGTFQTVPSILFQFFTIMVSVVRTHKGIARKIAIQLVYALIENKIEQAYSKVLEVTLSSAERLRIRKL